MTSHTLHRHLAALILMLGCSLSITAEVLYPEMSVAGYNLNQQLDFPTAEAMLDNLPLGDQEGIWYDPIDDMSLLILRDRSANNAFGVFVLHSKDCRLHPGMRIATLTPSADPKLFKLTLLSSYHPKKGLHLPLDATAKANADYSTLYLDFPKIKVSFSPNIILPNLINLVRFRVNVRYSDPNDKLLDGWHKTYPSANSNSEIIYL